MNTAPSYGMPHSIGIIHFTGIGGIGMSGVAEILHNLGYAVQGSDNNDNANVQRLKSLGIPVIIGQQKGNLGDAAVVVKSTAVKADNPELMDARERNIPIVHRSEMLAELTRLKTTIAIAGTHGKTTTTSLVASMFDQADKDPTVINGGIINSYNTNARLGKGDYLIAEADESDGTFLKLFSTIAIVTNIDPEHLDHYGSFDQLRIAFRQFIERLPFYGFAVLNIDHPEVAELANSIKDRKIITYGIESQHAAIRATNIAFNTNGSCFDVIITATGHTIKNITLPIPGAHNISNALAAIGVALEMGFDNNIIISAFKQFGGVKRRFTQTGIAHGVTIIDDYGHHPTEIAATLKAARDIQNTRRGRVIAVVQPHRYTRVHDLFTEFCQCFTDADSVIVADIFAAGETPIDGISKESLAQNIQCQDIHTLSSPDDLGQLIASIAQDGDMVVCLGAGNITQWAYALPDSLQALSLPTSSKAGVS